MVYYVLWKNAEKVREELVSEWFASVAVQCKLFQLPTCAMFHWSCGDGGFGKRGFLGFSFELNYCGPMWYIVFTICVSVYLRTRAKVKTEIVQQNLKCCFALRIFWKLVKKLR